MDTKTHLETVYIRVRRDILDKSREAGSECSTRSLATEFGCGTQVVRSALLSLEQEGYLSRGVKDAFVVRTWSVAEIDIAFDLKTKLLHLAADRCRTRLSAYERNSLRRIMTARDGPSQSQPILVVDDFVALTRLLDLQICQGSMVQGISEAFERYFPSALHRSAAELMSDGERQEALDGARALLSFIDGDTGADVLKGDAERNLRFAASVAAWHSTPARLLPPRPLTNTEVRETTSVTEWLNSRPVSAAA